MLSEFFLEAILKQFFFWVHAIISEHAAIEFQPTPQDRTACTKTICLHAQRLWHVPKKKLL